MSEPRDPWDATIERIERRGKRLLAMVVTLAGALATTAVLLIAAWQQVADKVERVEDHVESVDAVTQDNLERLEAVEEKTPQ